MASTLLFTGRLTEAVEYIRQHHTECRKGGSIPYLAHLFGVASLVMNEADGPVPVTEEMVLAALLHDVAEDHGGLVRLREIEATFGPQVASFVAGLSDTLAEAHQKKERWEERKQNYLDRLLHESDEVLLISVADKLHNARAILEDYRVVGDALWSRFRRGAREQVWYFDALCAVFNKRREAGFVSRNFGELEQVVRAIHAELGF